MVNSLSFLCLIRQLRFQDSSYEGLVEQKENITQDIRDMTYALTRQGCVSLESRAGCGREKTLTRIVRAGVIAAIYVGLTYALAPISFGQLQFRVAEGLSVLPILYPEAVPALFVGCLLANIIGPYGILDIVLGSLTTLLAAVLTRVSRKSIIAYFWPIALNALIVSAYLSFLAETKASYWVFVLSIGISEAAAVILIGVPLIRFLKSSYPDSIS